jgi:hypothetical protein
MNGQPSPAPPNRKTRRLKIVALILVSLIVLYMVYRHALSVSIQRRIDAIHQAGFPATCAELDKWYVQPPAGENAANAYKEAFAHYQFWTNKDAQFSMPVDARYRSKFSSPPKLKRDLLPVVGTAKLPPRTEPLTPETQKLVAQYLSDNAESLRLIHEAALMKSCRYPIYLSDGLRTLLPHLNAVRHAARLLELESCQYTEEQQSQPAVESVIVSLGASRSVNQEPTILSYLVYVASGGITLESLERILNRIPLTDAQLSKLAAAIQESENHHALTRAFVGDRCMYINFFPGLRAGKYSFYDFTGSMGDEDALWRRFLFLAYKTTGLLELDEREYLDNMERYVKATQLLPPESIAASDAVNETVEHLDSFRLLSRLQLPALDIVMRKAARCDAKIRDTQTSLAIERYRLANGKLPNQLSDLVPTFLPSVPTDPFDGKPLRYKTLSKGYIVYSVGEDREDNGGVEKNNKGISYVPGTDITFTVER